MAAARDKCGCAPKHHAEQQVLLGDLLKGRSLADKQEGLERTMKQPSEWKL